MSAVKVVILCGLICVLPATNALDEDIQGIILRRLTALETQLEEVTKRGKLFKQPKSSFYCLRMLF